MRRQVAMATVMVVLAGCSSGGDDRDGGSDGSNGGGIGLAEGMAALPALEELPDDVMFGDLARAADLAGVELTGEPGSEEAALSIIAITGGPVGDDGEMSDVVVRPPDVSHFRQMEDMEAFADELGWSLLDVDGFVEHQAAGNRVTVLAGDFEGDRLSAALGEPEGGVWVAGDPEQPESDERTAARLVGEPLWLALVGDRLVVTRSAEAMVAVRSGTARTLADDPILMPLAEALDEEGVYAAWLTGSTLALPGSCATTLPEPLAAVASGIADDDGPVMVLAYANVSPAGAQANAVALETLLADGSSPRPGEQWSDQVEVEKIDVEGHFVVARLRLLGSASASLWYDTILTADNIASYCE